MPVWQVALQQWEGRGVVRAVYPQRLVITLRGTVADDAALVAVERW